MNHLSLEELAVLLYAETIEEVEAELAPERLAHVEKCKDCQSLVEDCRENDALANAYRSLRQDPEKYFKALKAANKNFKPDP